MTADYDLDPPLSDPAKLVLRSAEGIQRERGESEISATDLLFAFIRVTNRCSRGSRRSTR